MNWIEILWNHIENFSIIEIGFGAGLTAAAALILAAFRRQGWVETRQVLCSLGTVVYLYLVYLITIFSRSPAAEADYVLTPFWSYAFIIHYQNRAVLEENILNILLLMPAAVLVCEAAQNRKAVKWITLGALGVSISIEVTQLVLKRGLFEWDDMFHNTLGAYLGSKAWCWLRKIKKDSKTQNKTQQEAKEL